MKVKHSAIAQLICRHPRREYYRTKTKTEAANKAPWAVIVIDCEGGYVAFESVEDYRHWARIDALTVKENEQ